MAPFTYRRALSLDDASRLATEEGAMLLAGGQTLLRDIKLGLRSPASLVDIGSVLPRKVEQADDAIAIGAGVTHAEVAASPVVRRHLPVLAALAGHIGDPAVRNRATLGGALAANEPAGDYPAACLALGAIIRTTSRNVEASVFFAADRPAKLEPGEIMTAVTFPVTSRAAYIKFLNPAARYAMVGAFASIMRDGEARVAITGARASGAFRWNDAEAALGATLAIDRLRDVRLPLEGLLVDLFADARYRQHLASVLARRAVTMASRSEQQVLVLTQGARPTTPKNVLEVR